MSERPPGGLRYRRVMTQYHPTSSAAWRSVFDYLPVIDRAILGVIYGRGGATCGTVEDQTALKHQTVSAQIRHMVEGGMVRDSGRKATVQSGRLAIVWEVVQPGPPAERMLF